MSTLPRQVTINVSPNVGRFLESMTDSVRQVAEAMGEMANQLARAFGVPMFLVAPEWERRVDRARRQRVASQMRAYHRRATRRAARARRRTALGSAA